MRNCLRGAPAQGFQNTGGLYKQGRGGRVVQAGLSGEAGAGSVWGFCFPRLCSRNGQCTCEKRAAILLRGPRPPPPTGRLRPLSFSRLLCNQGCPFLGSVSGRPGRLGEGCVPELLTGLSAGGRLGCTWMSSPHSPSGRIGVTVCPHTTPHETQACPLGCLKGMILESPKRPPEQSWWIPFPSPAGRWSGIDPHFKTQAPFGYLWNPSTSSFHT